MFRRVPPQVQFQRREQIPLRVQVSQMIPGRSRVQNINGYGPALGGGQFQRFQQGNPNFRQVNDAGYQINQQGPPQNAGRRQWNVYIPQNVSNVPPQP